MSADARPRRVLVGFRMVEALRDVLQGVGSYIKQHQLNWRVNCVDADQFASLLKPKLADGVITVISPASRALLRQVKRSRIPAVNMLHDAHDCMTSVLSDDVAIGRSAAQYLIGRGFRHFAYLGFASNWSHNRLRGFEQVLAESGHSCDVYPGFIRQTDYRKIETTRSSEAVRRWVIALPKPAAVLVCSDLIARSLLVAAEAVDIRIPEEMAILGVDNIVTTCELASVPLSSVAQDFPQLGFEAARALDRLMSGASPPKHATIIPPGAIAVRRSTDVFAFDDQYVSTAMRIIHERATSGIGMKELIRHVPVSRRWLDARFKALIGHTASHEIRRLRLARVCELLLHTDLSIKQISMRCGYPRAENLIRSFRDAYGSPPQTYRRCQSIVGMPRAD